MRWPMTDRLTRLARPAVFLGRNPWSMAGAVLTTSSALTLLGFWLVELISGRPSHPYQGIVFFLVLPALFCVGLALVPLGLWLRRRRLRRRGALPAPYPDVDLNQPLYRNALILVALLTFLNVSITGTASYKAVEYMDSSEFCGLACHTVMQPEWTAFVDSPHASVGCVSCHIGPGASSFVRAKLAGVRQLLAVASGSYSRPIPPPLHELRSAREICEQCHWAGRFYGDRLRLTTSFAADESNTRLVTALLMKLGGPGADGPRGIHGRHLERPARIRYSALDEQRQQIARVSWIDDAGEEVVFTSPEIQATEQQLAAAGSREMDCLDCHTRPSHAFDSPERAVDEAMAAGRISPELPWVKKRALELLRSEYRDRESAGRLIQEQLVEHYRSQHPDRFAELRPLVERAGRALAQIWLRNVFPEMRVSWGSYLDNLGHLDSLGCFRCHDESHQSQDGRTISQDCELCHGVIAMEEEDPELLAQLGYAGG